MNESVRYLNPVAVDQAVLDSLAQLPFSKTGTRRICLHKTEDSPLHVMLVESQAAIEFPAHCHMDGDEFSTVITGQLELLVWDRGGDNSPSRILIGGDAGAAKATFVPRGVPHITRAVNGNCIYIEVKLGPFNKEAMVLTDMSQLKMS